jgi:hypothetical protein
MEDWLAQSTAASGVSLRVSDEAILLDIAAQIVHTQS